jgi:PAS domain S-box-containing protein
VFWRADGTSFSAEYWSYPIHKDGRLAGSVVTFLDITERKQAEEALRKSEERYREVIENATYGIFRSSPEGDLLYVNPALVTMLGYASKEELQTHNLAQDIYQTPADRAAVLSRYGPDGRLDGVELNWKRKDGKVIEVRISGRVLRNDDGTVRHYEAIVADVTERRLLEEQLRQAQKIEAVGRLAGGVAHDFNNILGVIMGYTDLLLEQTNNQQTEQRLLEIKKAAGRAASLTRQLLAFSRKQVFQVRVLDLNTIITDITKLLLRLLGEDVDLVTQLSSDPVTVKGDPSQIEQVIINLAVNARDAMPNGGTLSIETARLRLDEQYAQHHIPLPAGQYVMLAISDTGTGMTEEVKSRIFEPFFTTKDKDRGTGLGLATVYGVVKQSEGFIWVYSELGHGSTFKVYLPMVEEEVEQIEHPAEFVPLPGGSETILMVEDSDSLRELNHELLQRMGYTVLVAEAGDEAIRIAEHHAETIDLLLTDVVMPRMNGRALAEALARSRPAIKVLYMSGYTDNVIVNQALLKPGVAFLQKPFTRELLARKVREVLATPVSD